MSNYYDKQAASAKLAEALMDAGWQVDGYSENKSDPMTDYYHPASWMGGVAWKGPLTLVCLIRPLSGARWPARDVFESVECTACNGDGIERSGWTLEKARAAPVEYNRARLVAEYGEEAVAAGRVFAGLAGVVSPLMFHDDRDGFEKCHKCHGTGTIHLGREQGALRYTVPAHLANPPRSHWHLERNGVIVRSGWLKTEWERDSEALAAFVRELQAAETAGGYATAIHRDEVTAATIQRNEARGGIEVIFPAKPAANIIEGLKGLGFRWSRPQGLWWARHSERVETGARKLLGLPAEESNELAGLMQAHEELAFERASDGL